MRIRLAFFALLVALVAPLSIPSAEGGSLPDKAFRIKSGQHYDTTFILNRTPGLHLSGHTDRTLTFKARFHADAAYATQIPANQFDWCKLMGISTLRIHHNSIRLGWRYSPSDNKIELGFYGYIQDQRFMEPIGKVDFNQWADVEIHMSNAGLMVRVGANRVQKNMSLGLSSFFPTATVILDTAYFGGDETAPHDIHIDVKDIGVQ